MVDFSDPANPVEVAAFHGSGGSFWGIHVQDDLIFASDMTGTVYILKIRNFDQSSNANTFTDELLVPVADEYALLGNFPNPFNPVTNIKFSLPQAGEVSLKVFNSTGQLVKNLISDSYEAGYHEIRWDATDNLGFKVPSGIYLYQFKSGNFNKAGKMILMK